MSAKNPLKRYKDKGTLGLYHEYRFKDPGTGTGCLLDHSGNGLHGSAVGTPTWDNGYTFAQGDAITVDDNDTGLDSLFNVDDLTFIIIFDEISSDHDDTINVAGNNRECAFYLGRNNDGAGGTYGHRFYSYYDNLNSKRYCRFDHDQGGNSISETYGDNNYYPLYDSGSRAYCASVVKSSAPDLYAQKSFVGDSGDSYLAHLVDTYPDTNDLFIGNFPINPLLDAAQAGYKFPCLDKIQAVVILTEALDADEVVELTEHLLAVGSGDLRQHFGTQGGSRLEFAFHILGYPYGLSTSKDLNEALDVNLAMKRKLYGLASDANSVYLADDVPTFDLLERPGRMGMTLDFDKAKIKGGNWKAIISNEQIGYSWPHRTDSSDAANNTIQVLDGIATIPNTANDSTINWCTLGEDVKKADTSFDVTEENDESLIDKISTRNGNGDTTILFFGNETLAVDDVTDNGDGTYTLTGVTRGAYKSMIESHLIEEFDGKSEKLADAPLGGAPGRWYELYAFAIDDATGALLDEPFLMRFGQIQSDVSISRSKITIGCGSFNTAIDKSTNIINATGHLAKYVLCRPNIGTTSDTNNLNHSPAPHIMIAEDGTLSNIQNIWLCDQNSSVTYDTLDDLMLAIQRELNYCSAGSASQESGDGSSSNALIDLTYHYVVTRTGIYAVDAISNTTDGPLIGGVLPWLLSLFSPVLSDFASEDRLGIFGNVANAPNPSGHIALADWANWIAGMPQFNVNELFWRNRASAHMMPMRLVPWHEMGEEDYEFMTESPGLGGDWDRKLRARYIVQPDLDSVTDTTTGVVELPDDMQGSTKWPVPATIYTEPGFDASKYANEVCILGSEGGGQKYGTVNVTTVTPGNYNALTCTTGNGHGFDLKGGLPAVNLYDPPDVAGTTAEGLPLWTPLYWLPGTEDIPDPWAIRPVGCFDDKYFTNLLIGVSGNGTVSVPEKYQVQVPWLYDDTRGDFAEAIDWSELNLIHDPIAPGQYYKLRLGREQFNWGESFCNELALHGIQPIWKPDFIDRTWKIGFRLVGPANKTKATWEGRSFDSGSLISDGSDSFSLIEARRFNQVKVSVDYDSDQEKFLSNLTLDLKSQIQTNRDSKLVLESKISNFDQTLTTANKEFYSAMLSHIGRIMKHLSMTSATYSGEATVDKLWSCQLGNEITVTDDSMLDPTDGTWGISDKSALVSSVTTDFRRPNQSISFGYSITEDSEYGIAPSMRVQANNSSKDESKVTITPDENYFSLASSTDRVDMAWFDCLDYDPGETTDPTDSSNYSARNCSCDDYKVIAFERNEVDMTILSFTLKNVDIDAGTCELWGTTTNWDTAEEYIVLFAPWNTAGLADCQRKFLAFCTRDRLLIDAASNEYPAHKVV